MFKSLLNSVRGISALYALEGDARRHGLDFSRPAVQPARLAPRPAVSVSSQGRGSVGAVTPERCCVYCGHPLFAPPRAPRIRCPRCFEELPVRDIVLDGRFTESRALTAGKIVVRHEARVESQLVACSVVVEGQVVGEILASQVCRLRPTARVSGRILCRKLMMDPGARLDAQIEIIQEE